MKTSNPLLPDYQRAAALIAHYGRNDPVGAAIILSEANADGGQVRLLFAVLDTYRQLVPAMHTERGLSLFADMAVELADSAERRTP